MIRYLVRNVFAVSSLFLLSFGGAEVRGEGLDRSLFGVCNERSESFETIHSTKNGIDSLLERVYPAEPIVGPVYYVAPHGDDSRSKAQAANPSTPWQTLQRAANDVVAGDTVVVKDGVYTRDTTNFLVDLSRSGTASTPIRFVSQNKWGAILDGNYQNHSLFNLRADVSHIVIEGFEVRNGRHSSFWNNPSSGHNVGLVFRGNWIHHVGRNRTTPCTNGGPSGATGIILRPRSRYAVIEGNLIHSNGRFADDACPGENKFDHGIYVQGHGHIIRNNILFDHFSGWDVKADHSTESGFSFPDDERAGIYINNTFASRHPIRPGHIALYRNSGDTPKNVLIMNNIGWNSRGALIEAGAGGWPWPGTEVINNITTATAVIAWNWAGGDDSEVYNMEGNTLNAKLPDFSLGMASPKTSSAVDTDFRLTENATLLIGRGKYSHGRSGLPTVVAPSTDYAGTPRPHTSGVDLGAYAWIP